MGEGARKTVAEGNRRRGAKFWVGKGGNEKGGEVSSFAPGKSKEDEWKVGKMPISTRGKSKENDGG